MVSSSGIADVNLVDPRASQIPARVCCVVDFRRVFSRGAKLES